MLCATHALDVQEKEEKKNKTPRFWLFIFFSTKISSQNIFVHKEKNTTPVFWYFHTFLLSDSDQI